MEIKAAVCHGLNEPLKIENLTLEPPKADEVLIEVVATGFCHTDASGQNGTLPVPFPIVFGHEGAGIVREVGAAVRSVEPGDHVVISIPYCGHCRPCLFGRPGECEHAMEANFGGFMLDKTTRLSDEKGEPVHMFFGQSTFASYAVANEKSIVKVDKEVDLALLGPLGCGFLTGSGTVMEGIKPRIGSSIAILGCGGVGLSALMAAKISGCSTIIALDLNESRLEMAKELGATHTINGKTDDILETILAITDGYGVEYAIDASGSTFVVSQGIKALAHGGEMVLVAAGYDDLNLDINMDIFLKTRSIRGMIEGAAHPKHLIPILIDFYKKGLYPFDKLIQFYEFEDINQAFEDSASGQTIKPVIKLKS